jgi:hypothetical protein
MFPNSTEISRSSKIGQMETDVPGKGWKFALIAFPPNLNRKPN